jgi:DNA-directed RNA polymerase subunit RPC12/RpoP
MDFEMSDVVLKASMFYLDCPECKSEILIKQRLPLCWQDYVVDKEENK